jgi:protein-S-isoprenylcysteine O-methyltransferase Ste14
MLHSALISRAVTAALQKRFPSSFRFYRILYNLFAVVTLLPVLYYSFSQRGETLVAWTGPWRIISTLLGSVALILFVTGARHYDFRQFVGIRQIKSEKACSVLTDDCSLDTTGVLSVVRHPWYCAGIFIVWARPLDLAAIWTNLVVSGYLVVGSFLEERKLQVQFGEQYTDYQRRVSMFVPIKWVRRRFLRKN